MRSSGGKARHRGTCGRPRHSNVQHAELGPADCYTAVALWSPRGWGGGGIIAARYPSGLSRQTGQLRRQCRASLSTDFAREDAGTVDTWRDPAKLLEGSVTVFAVGGRGIAPTPPEMFIKQR